MPGLHMGMVEPLKRRTTTNFQLLQYLSKKNPSRPIKFHCYREQLREPGGGIPEKKMSRSEKKTALTRHFVEWHFYP